MITEPVPDKLFIWRLDARAQRRHARPAEQQDRQGRGAAAAVLRHDRHRSCGQGVLELATPGPHGANMDFNEVVEGVTMQFPVFEPGALFMLGDGHAAQGDGEIDGAAIETSFDVRSRSI